MDENLSSEPQDINVMERMLSEAEAPQDDLQEPTKQAEETSDKAESDGGAERDAPELQSDTSNDRDEQSGSDVEDKLSSPTGDKSDEQPPSDELEKELEEIQLKTGASTKSQEALRVLKDKVRKEYNARVKAEKSALEKDLKLKDSEGKLPENVGKELEELRRFRRAIDLDNDPEFNEKYTAAIQKEEEGAVSLLKSWKLPDSAANYIVENGGIAKFRSSEQQMPEDPRFYNEDGSKMTHADWWEKFVEDRLTRGQKEELGDRLSGIRAKNREREQALSEAVSNRGKLMEERLETQKRHAEDWHKRVSEHAPKVMAKFGDDAKKKEIPADASPEEKASAEKHNARLIRANDIVKKYMTKVTPENIVESAIGAAYSDIAQEEIKEYREKVAASEKRIKELEEQINGIKSAGKTSHRNSAPTTNKQVLPKGANDEDAMAALIGMV